MSESATAFAPGRVNLIGEHTDYNEGLALPFAIEQGVTVEAVGSDDDQIRVRALDLDAHDTFPVHGPKRIEGWRAFARGAVSELSKAGAQLGGARLEISATLPRGSGLSSSAALEVALCLALLAVSGSAAPDRVELARLCSRIENDWVGAQTGLLDQLASLCGHRDQAMRIDFRSLEVTPVALDLAGYSLVTVDSGQRHANAGRPTDTAGGQEEPDYNQRRRECADACARLGVPSLRDVTPEMAAGLPHPLDARALHVIAENERVDATVAALSDGDLRRVGELLNESHASLRDRYEVSTPAVERTVSRLLGAGAVGARIVGGGFGGHVLGLLGPGVVPPDDAAVVVPGPGAHVG